VIFLLQQTDDSFSLFAEQKPVPKAAIVDHLSTSWPNPAFVEESTTILRGARYDVDYYEGLCPQIPVFGDVHVGAIQQTEIRV
jgi:hypothetical protein